MSVKTTQVFTVKEEHLNLIRRMYIGWNDCEFGAPEVDPKRPYGNSFVYGDIGEILGIEPAHGDEFSREQTDQMWVFHRETQTALQIAIATGTFETGTYRAELYGVDWKKEQA